jgi:hypothetical protein
MHVTHDHISSQNPRDQYLTKVKLQGSQIGHCKATHQNMDLFTLLEQAQHNKALKHSDISVT